ncbi:MAG: hypothetical protein WBN89_03900 [Prochlorococcaceae cyanobacterium]
MIAPARLALIPQNLVSCVCLANKLPCELCCGDLCFLDDGIHVVFKPKRGEAAVAVALDGCVFTDNRKKCDGMFVFSRAGQIYVLLVELKGSHIDDAYEQISYVVNHRQEYRDFVNSLNPKVANARLIREKSFIVTTGAIDLSVQQKLENAYRVRPEIITVEKPASLAPDLRKKI